MAGRLRHGILVMIALFATIGLNVYLFTIVPKGFFPQQDTGRLIGTIQADQSISFQAMRNKLGLLQAIVQNDPAIASVKGYTGTGAGQTNSGLVFIDLKPKSERSETADEVIARLRRQLVQVPGARLFLQSVQDIRMGGRASNAQYQFTLQGDDVDELYAYVPRLVEALQRSSVLTDVNSDQQQTGLETNIVIDRDTASRLGLVMSQIDNTLYDAFGQRQVSIIYSAVNQYHVVMEVDPRYWQDPSILKDLYVSTSGASPSGTATSNALAGTVTRGAATLAPEPSNTAQEKPINAGSNSARNAATNALANTGRGSTSAGSAVSTSKEINIPLAAFSHFGPGHTALNVNHQGLFVASTISYQFAARRLVERRRRRNHENDESHRHARQDSGQHAGDRSRVPGIAGERKDPDHGGAGDGLYRPWNSLRKLHSSDHHPLHPAVGRRRRGPRTFIVQYRVQHYFPDRRDFAHWDREKERDHDDRLRP